MADLPFCGELLDRRRPRRADAARNFDALLDAAAAALAEQGKDVPLEEIARRAGVGIGTLYRNFPTREDLVEAVYLGEVEAVCRYAREVSDREPGEALRAWLLRFIGHMASKPALVAGMREHSEAFATSRAATGAAAAPLLAQAQRAGSVRADVSVDDVLRLAAGVGTMSYTNEAQCEHVIAIALDGLRPP